QEDPDLSHAGRRQYLPRADRRATGGGARSRYHREAGVLWPGQDRYEEGPARRPLLRARAEPTLQSLALPGGSIRRQPPADRPRRPERGGGAAPNSLPHRRALAVVRQRLSIVRARLPAKRWRLDRRLSGVAP